MRSIENSPKDNKKYINKNTMNHSKSNSIINN
jgi:hypothetical protein